MTDHGDHTAPHVGRDVTEDVTDTDLFWIVVNIFEETLLWQGEDLDIAPVINLR